MKLWKVKRISEYKLNKLDQVSEEWLIRRLESCSIEGFLSHWDDGKISRFLDQVKKTELLLLLRE